MSEFRQPDALDARKYFRLHILSRAKKTGQNYALMHDLLDSQSVYSGLGVDRKILCSHDSDV
jgi:hypothetical protein